MKMPMTTQQAEERFGADGSAIESSTCSMNCRACGERIWFQGSWSDVNIPKMFDCPYCESVQVDPFTAAPTRIDTTTIVASKVIPHLDKGDLSILITICEKELEFSAL